MARGGIDAKRTEATRGSLHLEPPQINRRHADVQEATISYALGPDRYGSVNLAL